MLEIPRSRMIRYERFFITAGFVFLVTPSFCIWKVESFHQFQGTHVVSEPEHTYFSKPYGLSLGLDQFVSPPRTHMYAKCRSISCDTAREAIRHPSGQEPERRQQKEQNNLENGSVATRRRALQLAWTAALSLSFLPFSVDAAIDSLNDAKPSSSETKDASKQEVKVSTLPSGVKIIDLKEGTGPTIQYGQLASIGYKGYVKVGSSSSNANGSEEPPMFDKVPQYLIKHGNGRIIPGLDEGIHTMKVGGLRRIIIPPKLGYIDIGLGPIPEGFYERYKLNKLLDQMVASGSGRIIFEVELLSAFNDEADQGYYNDKSLTPEQFNTLRENLERKQREARAAGNSSSISGQDA